MSILHSPNTHIPREDAAANPPPPPPPLLPKLYDEGKPWLWVEKAEAGVVCPEGKEPLPPLRLKLLRGESTMPPAGCCCWCVWW